MNEYGCVCRDFFLRNNSIVCHKILNSILRNKSIVCHKSAAPDSNNAISKGICQICCVTDHRK